MTDKERIQSLEERVTALERQLQGQPTLSRDDLDKIERELARRIALGIARK
mgnify:CR=1 FL=1